MNALKRILNKQTWIQELKQMKLAVKAVEPYAAKYIPSHIKQEMRIAAAQGQVPYFDIVCSNLAYEIAMIATTPGKLDVGGMWKSLIGLPATRVGCTSFGYWGVNDVYEDTTMKHSTARSKPYLTYEIKRHPARRRIHRQ